ncbi:reverse transcriptase domain-containing protein [Tanacetum coccineum]
MEGHHSASITGRKVYEFGFYWPSIFKDAKDYVMKCDACQRSGNISSRSEICSKQLQVNKVSDGLIRVRDEVVGSGDGPCEGNIDEYWWRIYESGNLEVLES